MGRRAGLQLFVAMMVWFTNGWAIGNASGWTPASAIGTFLGLAIFLVELFERDQVRRLCPVSLCRRCRHYRCPEHRLEEG